MQSFDPSSLFMWGFKGPAEDVDAIIASDREIVARLGVTHEQIASLIDAIFASREDTWRGYPIIRWYNIHSPICPWGDFCTKSCLDLTLAVTEIWLVNPDAIANVNDYVSKVTGRVYPIQDLKQLVDWDWITVFSDLHPHLIREHHFFEGHETPYRVHPERVMKFL